MHRTVGIGLLWSKKGPEFVASVEGWEEGTPSGDRYHDFVLRTTTQEHHSRHKPRVGNSLLTSDLPGS